LAISKQERARISIESGPFFGVIVVRSGNLTHDRKPTGVCGRFARSFEEPRLRHGIQRGPLFYCAARDIAQFGKGSLKG